jgi:hypothetical protein
LVICELKTSENENKNNCNILLVINKVRNRELEMLFYRVHGQSVCSIHNLVWFFGDIASVDYKIFYAGTDLINKPKTLLVDIPSSSGKLILPRTLATALSPNISNPFINQKNDVNVIIKHCVQPTSIQMTTSPATNLTNYGINVA